MGSHEIALKGKGGKEILQVFKDSIIQVFFSYTQEKTYVYQDQSGKSCIASYSWEGRPHTLCNSPGWVLAAWAAALQISP